MQFPISRITPSDGSVQIGGTFVTIEGRNGRITIQVKETHLESLKLGEIVEIGRVEFEPSRSRYRRWMFISVPGEDRLVIEQNHFLKKLEENLTSRPYRE